MRNSWTENEIESLKSSFLKGESLKLIARGIGRSPTAINKALTRFGIRPLLRKNQKINFSSCMKELPLSKKKKHTLDTQWVTLDQLVEWLRSSNVDIGLHQPGRRLYYVNHKVMTIPQIIVLANQLRYQKKLPIFLVDQVTGA